MPKTRRRLRRARPGPDIVFWSKRPVLECGLTDIHCHILPGIDDGPATLAEALDMAAMAVKDGTRRIIATPHINDTYPDPGSIQQRAAVFNAELRRVGIPLEVLPGAELQGTAAVENLRKHTLNGTAYVLIEFPQTHLPSNARQVIFDSLVAGLRPVIAHPERNLSVIDRPQLLMELVRAGALAQISGESLTGSLGPDVLACAGYLLKEQAVHFLASDGHGSCWRRPILSRALRAAGDLVGKEAAMRLVSANPEALLKGKPLG